MIRATMKGHRGPEAEAQQLSIFFGEPEWKNPGNYNI
jgi:hypothetical protein